MLTTMFTELNNQHALTASPSAVPSSGRLHTTHTQPCCESVTGSNTGQESLYAKLANVV